MPAPSEPDLTPLLAALSRALTTHTDELDQPPDRRDTPAEPTAESALMTVADAARLLGISRSAAYRYADHGDLPAKRFGRRVYIVRTRLIQSLAEPAPDTDAPEIAA